MMRLNDAPIVFSLFCVLIAGFVDSANDCGDGWYGPLCKFRCKCAKGGCDSEGKCADSNKCQDGWFGLMCKYKCRCVDDSCDTTGQCTGSKPCQGGWFGPECQYADIAYKTTATPVLTDGDDATCIAVKNDTVTISLNESIVFTWLRVYAKEKAGLEDLSATFSAINIPVVCTDLKKYVGVMMTLDMHCNLTAYIDTVTLNGAAVGNLCSVYISGGRNVALKERAEQALTLNADYKGVKYNYTADLAVDGDTNPDFLSAVTCSHTYNSSKWTLKFVQPRSVHRYFFYNREDAAMSRLVGFTVQSYNAANKSVFVYQDSLPKAEKIYTVKHMPLPVSMVVITVLNNIREKVNILGLCEVEIYGDSICDPLHWGRDCEHGCQCVSNETCVVSTGDCPNGCAEGLYGPGCANKCPFGKFGPNCNSKCSPNCEPPDDENTSLCNEVHGECNMGCKSGFTGENCDSECYLTFGKDCNQSCSAKCEVPDNVTVPLCHISTGVCLNGCKSGFMGDLCQLKCSLGKFGNNCSSECSENCEPPGDIRTSSCNETTGACNVGCNIGFTGATCTSECSPGSFGKDCSSSCPKTCGVSDDPNITTCDPATGVCIKGCMSGYSGDSCQRSVNETPTSSSYLPWIIALCAFVGMAFLAGICLKRKKHPRLPPERTAEVAQPTAVTMGE